jgi:hypothetical protein
MTLLAQFESTLKPSEREYLARMRDVLKQIGEKDFGFNSAILWNGQVVPADFFTCSMWLSLHPEETAIGRDVVNGHEVITSFCPVPFGWNQNEPQHFETMIDMETVAGRYQTLQTALIGHAAVLYTLSLSKKSRFRQKIESIK